MANSARAPAVLRGRRRKTAIAWMGAIALVSAPPAHAHNEAVHDAMAQKAYEIMGEARGNRLLGTRPRDVTQAEWETFHSDAARAYHTLDSIVKRSGSNLDISLLLGQAAASIDERKDDTHLFYKPLSAGGMGALAKVADTAVEAAALAALVPVLCACACALSVLGLGADEDCDNCVEASKSLVSDLPKPGDLRNLVPGFGDESNADYVGLWHFINVAPSPLVTNTYDDHQGMLYEVAGPHQIPGAVDFAIMAATDILGLSVAPERSLGVKNYEIPRPGDAVADGGRYDGSVRRDSSDWQRYPIGHTPFAPIDNLALFGWREFRNGPRRIEDLGFALHAFGDASVPMHVTGTTGWGHRPFEESAEHMWFNGRLPAAIHAGRVMQRAYFYRKAVVAWQAAGHAKDVPVRSLVRAVARNTLTYSLEKDASPGLQGPWPFNDLASTLWQTGPEDAANAMYEKRSDAVALLVPLLEDSIAAQIAFLISAADVDGLLFVRPQPSRIPGKAWASVSPRLSFQAGIGSHHRRIMSDVAGSALRRRPSDPARDAFDRAVRMDYARLARLFIAGQLNPAQYLVRVRDRGRKVALAARTNGFYREFARGDADGDLIPDRRDESPETEELAPTSDRGRAVRTAADERSWRGPRLAEVQAILARMNMMITPRCAAEQAPDRPVLDSIRYLRNGTGFVFAVAAPEPRTTQCPVFYEFAVNLRDSLDRGQWPDTYRSVVFRADQGTMASINGAPRLLFPFRETSSEDGAYLVQNIEWYQLEWRGRAINANGVASSWSRWKSLPPTFPHIPID